MLPDRKATVCSMVVGIVFFTGSFFSAMAQAAAVTLFGEAAEIDTLLVREAQTGDHGPFTCNRASCIRGVTFKFNNAVAPFSDGTLTVVAGGDIGHRMGERTEAGFAETDFVLVFGGSVMNLSAPLISSDLFRKTVPNCPAGETRGLDANRMVCGPNLHSVVDPNNLLENAIGTAANGQNFFTSQLVAANRGDSVTIPMASLAALAINNTIELTLFPNPGASRNAGVGDIVYHSLALTYSVPEPSTLPLLGAGLAAAVASRRRKALPIARNGV